MGYADLLYYTGHCRNKHFQYWNSSRGIFLQRCHSSSISSDMILSSTSGPSGDGLRLKTTSGPSGDGLKTIETGRGRPTPVRAN